MFSSWSTEPELHELLIQSCQQHMMEKETKNGRREGRGGMLRERETEKTSGRKIELEKSC